MDEEKSTRKYFCITIIVVILSAVGLFFGTKYLLSDKGVEQAYAACGDEANAELVNQFVLGEFLGDYPWWNKNYSYFQQINIINKSKTGLASKCWVSFTFDHAYLVEENKSQLDGTDLKLLYYDGNSYKQISFTLSDTDSEETTVEFKLSGDIDSQATDYSYFLYYGNMTVNENKSIITSPKTDREFAPNYSISLGDEIQPKVKGTVSRQWLIKGIDDQESSNLTFTVEIDASIDTKKPPKYKIIGSDISGSTEKVYRTEYDATINASSLAPGTYHLQATVKDGDITHKSSKTPLFISYPLFVAATVDWEGYNVENSELDELIAFSKRHQDLPMTHFFNPRIYVTGDLTEDQADYLTQWIQVRKLNGDEIGMHLHMHLDMVAAAEVTPRTTPKWTTSLNNGHDVPSSAYSYDEYMQIVQWALNEFEEQGLGVPLSYRAGGWFANMDVLRAVNDQGFRVDSSGRDYYVWGANQLQGHWKLSSTTHPFRPSIANQNGSSPEPTLALWEFPNNGADSYFNGADELIKRFNDNFQKVALIQPQTVTYLTHPHEFIKDTAVLDPVFDYTGKYLAELDRGPVVYVTLEDAYEYWEDMY